jgi:hypothetical protein
VQLHPLRSNWGETIYRSIEEGVTPQPRSIDLLSLLHLHTWSIRHVPAYEISIICYNCCCLNSFRTSSEQPLRVLFTRIMQDFLRRLTQEQRQIQCSSKSTKKHLPRNVPLAVKALMYYVKSTCFSYQLKKHFLIQSCTRACVTPECIKIVSSEKDAAVSRCGRLMHTEKSWKVNGRFQTIPSPFHKP